jgi:hypothetical protein
MTLLDFMRDYWWLSIPVAGVFFVVIHTVLVKLIADSEKQAASAKPQAGSLNMPADSPKKGR